MPTNIALEEGTSFAAAAAQLRAAGLRYPLLAKPVWADGREGSHALAVVGSEAGLRQLVEGRAGEGFGLPVLVQEYVEHGGCLFKVRQPRHGCCGDACSWAVAVVCRCALEARGLHVAE